MTDYAALAGRCQQWLTATPSNNPDWHDEDYGDACNIIETCAAALEEMAWLEKWLANPDHDMQLVSFDTMHGFARVLVSGRSLSEAIRKARESERG